MVALLLCVFSMLRQSLRLILTIYLFIKFIVKRKQSEVDSRGVVLFNTFTLTIFSIFLNLRLEFLLYTIFEKEA